MSKKLSFFTVLLLALALLISGCTGEDQSAGALGDWNLQIVGDSLDITLDAAAMASREQIALECTNVSSTGEVVTTQIEGFSFGDLLAENGLEQASLSEITFVCADGYEMMIPAEIFKAKDIIIMLKQDGEPLTAPRSAIPDERAMFWAKDLTQIKIAGDGGAAPAAQGETANAAEKIIFFRQAASAMEAVEVQYKNAAIDGNYSLNDFADAYLGGVPEGTVNLTATDGFEKTESASAFFANYLLLENNQQMEGAPRSWSPEVGEGMNTKFLDLAVIGGNAVYFGAQTPVGELLAAAGLNADNYKFVASDGYEVEIPAAAISSGTILWDAEKKMMRADFTDGSLTDNQKKVKYLISVEVVK